jgi:hypothetical protein
LKASVVNDFGKITRWNLGKLGLSEILLRPKPRKKEDERANEACKHLMIQGSFIISNRIMIVKR